MAREDRICKECGKGEVEDVEHWLLRCDTWKTHREPLIAMVQEHYEVDQDDWLPSYYLLHADIIKCYLLSLTCSMRDLTELLVQYL